MCACVDICPVIIKVTLVFRWPFLVYSIVKVFTCACSHIFNARTTINDKRKFNALKIKGHVISFYHRSHRTNAVVIPKFRSYKWHIIFVSPSIRTTTHVPRHVSGHAWFFFCRLQTFFPLSISFATALLYRINRLMCGCQSFFLNNRTAISIHYEVNKSQHRKKNTTSKQHIIQW